MNVQTAIAHVYGDHIDTDRIIAGKYTKTLDMSFLADHVLEDLDPGFKNRVQPGDILVAGANFGCGSSREQAPLALKAAGIRVVVANYFARIFFRNAINIGLPVVEIGPHTIQPGSRVTVDLIKGVVVDEDTGWSYQTAPLPDVMLAILQAGGLVTYLRENKQYGAERTI